MTKEELIVFWSDKILQHLIKIRKEKYPDLTFWLRKKDGERLRKGYWFQGSNYIFIGLVNKNDSKNKTKQAGLVYDFKILERPTIHISLAFQGETDSATITCYNEIASKIDGFKKNKKGNYQKEYLDTDFIKVIDDFYLNEWKVFKDTFQKYELLEEMIIPEDKFQNLLNRTLQANDARDIRRR